MRNYSRNVNNVNYTTENVPWNWVMLKSLFSKSYNNIIQAWAHNSQNHVSRTLYDCYVSPFDTKWHKCD